MQCVVHTSCHCVANKCLKLVARNFLSGVTCQSPFFFCFFNPMQMSNVAICLLVCGANFVLIYKMHDSRDVCLLQLYGRVKCFHEENFRISMECCVVCAKIVNRYYAPLKKSKSYVLATIEQYSKQQIFLWTDFWNSRQKERSQCF